MSARRATAEGVQAHEPQWLHDAAQRTIELVYFAHIDQADWADHVLAKHGIGRPHHRVLYWTHKFPGISVRELMAILRVTNQALARTTTQLVTLGFLEQRYGHDDRRVRQHFLSKEGEALLAKLKRHQLERVGKFMSAMTREEIEALWFGLEAIMCPEDKRWLAPTLPEGAAAAAEAGDDAAAVNTGGRRARSNGGARSERPKAPAAKRRLIKRTGD